MEKAELVKMTRSSEYEAPHEADVHESEVESYKINGWVLDSDKKASKSKKDKDTE